MLAARSRSSFLIGPDLAFLIKPTPNPININYCAAFRITRSVRPLAMADPSAELESEAEKDDDFQYF